MVIDLHFLRRQDLPTPGEHSNPVAHIEVRADLHLGIDHFLGTGNQVLPANFTGLDDAP